MTTATTAQYAAQAAVRSAADEVHDLDEHLTEFAGRPDALARHLSGHPHWAGDEPAVHDGGEAALTDLHQAEHDADVQLALFRLEAAQDRAARPTATPLAGVIADARAEGLAWLSPPVYGGEPGADARGFVHLTLIFTTEDARRRFAARWRRSWVSTADRTCWLDYEFTWTDVNGAGLTLATYMTDAIGRDRHAGRRGAR
jgi:hypothetical protein